MDHYTKDHAGPGGNNMFVEWTKLHFGGPPQEHKKFNLPKKKGTPPSDGAYNYALHRPTERAVHILETHDVARYALDVLPPPKGCSNMQLARLWESCFIKTCLEDAALSAQILDVHRQIFHKYEEADPARYSTAVKTWIANKSNFPVNQKFAANRPWQQHARLGSMTFLLEDYAGIDHDPTAILLSGDFMKHLATTMVTKTVQIVRNQFSGSIQNRVRGFRTNQGVRNPYCASVGITDDPPGIDITLDTRYFDSAPWHHWGNGACDTTVKLSTYQKTATERSVPECCGVSGSTNFWLWTALDAQVALTVDETRLLVLSAYLTLGADGGHSLNEVLSSATVTAIYWHNYVKYCNQPKPLVPYLIGSTFSLALHEVTQHINPIGQPYPSNAKITTIGDTIYNTVPPKLKQKSGSPETPRNKELREQMEEFFVHGRRDLPFADYSAFLDQIKGMDDTRRITIEQMRVHQATCM